MTRENRGESAFKKSPKERVSGVGATQILKGGGASAWGKKGEGKKTRERVVEGLRERKNSTHMPDKSKEEGGGPRPSAEVQEKTAKAGESTMYRLRREKKKKGPWGGKNQGLASLSTKN